MFGYMDMLIIIKWNTNYLGAENEAPSIISTMVAMFLDGGRIKGRPFFKGNVIVSNLMLCKCISKSFMLLISDCDHLCALDAMCKTLLFMERIVRKKAIERPTWR